MSKDWTGNSNSIYKQLGASNHTEDEREENDYYATDPKAIDELFKVEDFGDVIFEPACGEGNLSKRMEDLGKVVISSDLVDRGYGETGVDFLKFESDELLDMDIITNPPYKFTTDFILKALSIIKPGRKVAFFLKLQTLEGQGRYKDVFSKYPPISVNVCTKRIQCAKNNHFVSSSAVCYAWFVWEKDNYDNPPIIRWINT